MNLRRSIYPILPILLLILSFAIPAAAAQTTELSEIFPFEDRTDPVLQIVSYYNAISLRDYERAYSYWESPPNGATLPEFTMGFANTQRVAAFTKLPVFVGAGAGNLFADVPVLLVAQHVDGTERLFSGCIRTHKVNVLEGDATEPDANWRLNDAEIVEGDSFDLSLLDTACEDLGMADEPYDLQASPVDLLASYFDAIEREDYARAYGYWENPPEPTLDEFAAGFADTDTVAVVLRLDVFEEGAAGSIYASIPAFVTVTTTSGGTQYFGGCYVTRHSNVPAGDATEPDPNWRLFESDVEEFGARIPDGLALLDSACAVVPAAG